MDNHKPVKEHVINICQIGRGSKTCRYLVASNIGMECAALDEDVRKEIDTRVKEGIIKAEGINCNGYTRVESVKILNNIE